MRVFKFGGASVKDAASVENVGQILSRFQDDNLIVIVSAMGKSTNALERIMDAFSRGSEAEFIQEINRLYQYHLTISRLDPLLIVCTLCYWLIDTLI